MLGDSKNHPTLVIANSLPTSFDFLITQIVALKKKVPNAFGKHLIFVNMLPKDKKLIL
jgi:hypothetical protein